MQEHKTETLEEKEYLKLLTELVDWLDEELTGYENLVFTSENIGNWVTKMYIAVHCLNRKALCYNSHDKWRKSTSEDLHKHSAKRMIEREEARIAIGDLNKSIEFSPTERYQQ